MISFKHKNNSFFMFRDKESIDAIVKRWRKVTQYEIVKKRK